MLPLPPRDATNTKEKQAITLHTPIDPCCSHRFISCEVGRRRTTWIIFRDALFYNRSMFQKNIFYIFIATAVYRGNFLQNLNINYLNTRFNVVDVKKSNVLCILFCFVTLLLCLIEWNLFFPLLVTNVNTQIVLEASKCISPHSISNLQNYII